MRIVTFASWWQRLCWWWRLSTAERFRVGIQMNRGWLRRQARVPSQDVH